MNEWQSIKFKDEDLPRAYTRYKGIYCICEPCSKNRGKFGVVIYTSEGDWQQGPYKIISIRGTYNEPNFKGITTLAKAQQLCLDTVELYLNRKIQPTVTERKNDPAKKTKTTKSFASRKRIKKISR